MKILLLALLLIVVLVVIAIIVITNHILNTPAANDPEDFIKRKSTSEGKILLTLGDSITHGVVSANYSNLLKSHMQQYGYETINAGMNADLAITALRKIEKIIACKPDIVTILLGTNDVMASEGETERNNYIKIKRLRKEDRVSSEFYETNLKSIVSKLKAGGVKQLFLVSLPLIGEDLSQEINDKTLRYSNIIKTIAETEGVNYVPLNETMREEVSKSENPTGFSNKKVLVNNLLIARHYFFGASLDKLFKHYGYQFLTEGVHLNSAGAELVSSLIVQSIDEQGLLVQDKKSLK